MNRFKNIIHLLLVFLFLAHMPKAFAQDTKKKPEQTDVTIKVKDEAGNPLPNVEVVVGEGLQHLFTDANGEVQFKAFTNNNVAVKLPGFESEYTNVVDLSLVSEVTLRKAKLYMSSEDLVQLPYTTLNKRYMVSSSSSIKGEALESYPNTDLRTSLSGWLPGLMVKERSASPGLIAQEGMGNFTFFDESNMYVRGLEPVVMIDGVIRQITEIQLDPQEVESITLLKDITAKALYGPAAANGVLYITTKRGRRNEREFHVSAETGVNKVDRFPEWVDAYDYAKLNNEARANDGLAPLYGEEALAGYAKGDPYNLKYPNANFNDMILKDQTPYRRVNVSSAGGTNDVQYFAYLGYSGEGDLYKIGPKADFNRVNARSNMDIKLNDYLKLQFDFYGQITLRNSPRYGYGISSFNNAPLSEFIMYSLDRNSIPANAFPIIASYDEENNETWYGVSSSYNSNPVGNMLKNGYYTETGRTGLANMALNYDMSHLIKGLSSKTYGSFDAYNMVRIGKEETYPAYIVNVLESSLGADSVSLVKVRDGVDQADESRLHDFYYQRFGFYQNLTFNRKFGSHSIHSSATYYISKFLRRSIEEPQRQQNVIWMANYNYKDKYSIQAVLNYAGTYSFDKGERYDIFPSIGANWIVSEEGFMKNMKFIDYLKVHAEGGVLGYEGFVNPYYYRSRWNINSSGNKFGPSPVDQWFGNQEDKSVFRTNPSRIGNTHIGWEVRREKSAGVEALMFNKSVYLEVNYYNNLRDGQIEQLNYTIPYVTGLTNSSIYANYQQTRYSGIETALQLTKTVGEVKLSVGGNATFQKSEILKYEELNYPNDYQKRVGKPADAYFGYSYAGRYADQNDIASSPSQSFDSEIKPGDLKYKDLNNDGRIDENDRSMVGNTEPRLFYGINLQLGYKNFDLSVLADGSAQFDIPMTSDYFWNGWGDDNYSKFVLNNKGGAYPRLTYNRVNNNFQSGDFWLMKGNYLKIQNAEFAYNLPVKVARVLHTRAFRIYVRGANLLTITKVEDIDPESTYAGVYFYPLMRTYTAGVKITL